MLLQKVDCSEDVVIAVIPHNTLEDTEVTFDEMANRFVMHIANVVQAVSEPD